MLLKNTHTRLFFGYILPFSIYFFPPLQMECVFVIEMVSRLIFIAFFSLALSLSLQPNDRILFGSAFYYFENMRACFSTLVRFHNAISMDCGK